MGLSPEASIGIELFGLSCTFALVSLRIWVQRHRHGNRVSSYICDVSVVLAFICDIFITSLDVRSSFEQARLPRDLSDELLNKTIMTPSFMKLYFAAGICYTFFLWLVKASFIALYFNLSAHFVRKARIALYIVTTYMAATFLASVIMKFLWCRPFHRNWSTGPDKCTFTIALPINTSTTVLNITTDICLLSLFLFIIYTLQLRNRELLGAIFVLIVGTCTVVAAGIRYAVIFASIKDSKASFRNSKKMLLWTNVEMGLALLAVCLPAFRVFLRKRSGSKSYSNNSAQRSRFQAKLSNGNRHATLVETELEPVGHLGRKDLSEADTDEAGSVERESADHETGSMRNLCPPPLARRGGDSC